jgi:hypothetical protein
MSSENDMQLHQLEVSMSRAKEQISKMECLKRLTTNKDFKELIEADYFTKEPSRLTLLLADPSCQDKEILDDIHNQMIAIAFLRRYFLGINQMGRAAINALEADEKTQEEILAEELGLETGIEG